MDYEYVQAEGVKEVQAFFLSAHARVDQWGKSLVNDVAEYAADRLRALAPGEIPALVSTDEVHVDAFGALQAIAGVEPDISRGTLGFSSAQGFDSFLARSRMPGIGSDPAHYPVFVDVGTGIYSIGPGAPRKPIHALPGSFMRFIAANGRLVTTTTVLGQPPKNFSRQAYAYTIKHLPFLISKAGHPLDTRRSGG